MAVLTYIWQHFTEIILGLNIILGLLLVFYERKHTSSLWAWLLVLYFLPIIGFILYLFLGRNLRRLKMFESKMAEDERQMALSQQKNLDLKGELPVQVEERYKDTVRMLLKASYASISGDNQVELLTNGVDKFRCLLFDLQNAKKRIYIQYYIFHDDEIGGEIMDVLCQKAREGLEVRLLVDGVGSRKTKWAFFRRLSEAGGYVAEFFPQRMPLIDIRINFRNHRKNVVIDDSIGYIGGYNVGDEYLDRGRLGHWQDLHLRIWGSAALDLKNRFMLDWNYASEDKIKPSAPLSRGELPQKGQAKRLFPLSSPVYEKVALQIVSSGPDSEYPNIRNGYARLMQEAEKSIYIETPYLILDDVISDSLQMAALSGLDVRVMIPRKADHFMIDGGNMSFVEPLLKAGVRIFLYEEGFVHAKMITVDNKLSSVGTANMDERSFRLDFEVNAFIYDEALSTALAQRFRTDMGDSTELTLEGYQNRSLWMRFKESLMRLISPLL